MLDADKTDAEAETDPVEKVLAEARKRYAEAISEQSENRDVALDDIKFVRAGEQWDDQAKQARYGRPMYTFNRLPVFVRQVVNDARQNKPTIRVRPVDSVADVPTSEVINGIFRHIEAISHADTAYDWAIENAASGGFGYVTVDMDYARDDSFEMEIFIRHVPNPFAIVYDPLSTAADSTDWRYAFEVQEFSKEDFEARWPNAESASFQDDDKTNPWITTDTVRVAKYWTREQSSREVLLLENGTTVDADVYAEQMGLAEGIELPGVAKRRQVKSWKVTHRLITGHEILEETEWPGRYIPIAPCYGDEYNIEGKRHFRSLCHNAKDAQRVYNYLQSAAVEMVALNPKVPWIGEEGAFDVGNEKWATANTKSHSYLEYPKGLQKPERAESSNLPASELQMSVAAVDNIQSIIGINAEGLGKQTNAQSGVAINRRKIESDVATFHFIDNLTRCIRMIGEIVLDLIPHVYSGERIVRVLGEDGVSKLAAIGQSGEEPPEGFPMLFDISAGQYDLVVQAGPSFTTRREEAAEQITEFIRTAPQAAGQVMDILAENLDWPGSHEMAMRFKQMLPPHVVNPQLPRPPPEPDPEMVKAQQQQKLKEAEFAFNQKVAVAELQHKQAVAEMEAQVKAKAQEDAARAELAIEIDRMNKEHELKQIEMQKEYELRIQELNAEADLSVLRMGVEAQTTPTTNLKRPE